jgi:VanZ family protein
MFFLALFPGSEMPDFLFFGVIPLDKVIHFVEYFIFTFLLIIGIYKQFGGPSFRLNLYAIAMLIALGFSFFLEFIQLAIPGRNFEILDLLANATGIVFGRFIFFLIYSLKIQ